MVHIIIILIAFIVVLEVSHWPCLPLLSLHCEGCSQCAATQSVITDTGPSNHSYWQESWLELAVTG